MQFAEKLDYLMSLADISNSKLAKDLNVDPSLISKWRRGVRALGHRPEMMGDIAERLAPKMTRMPLKEDFADMLGVPVEELAGEDDIEEKIANWLIETPRAAKGEGKNSGLTSPLEEVQAFTGQKGRQRAIAFMLKEVSKVQGGILRIYSDESPHWASLWMPLLKERLPLSHRFDGVKIIIPTSVERQTLRILFTIAEMFSSVSRIQVAYMDRLHYRLFQHSVVLASDNAGILAAGFAGGEGDVTTVHTKKAYLQELGAEFDKVYEQCVTAIRHLPMFNYAEAVEIVASMFMHKGDIYYKSSLIPSFLCPGDVLHEIFGNTAGKGYGEGGKLSEIPDLLLHFLQQGIVYATFPLASPEQIRNGEVHHLSGMMLEAGQYRRVLAHVLMLHTAEKNLRLHFVHYSEHANTLLVQAGEELVYTKAPINIAYVSDQKFSVLESVRYLNEYFGNTDVSKQQRETTRQTLQQYVDALEA